MMTTSDAWRPVRDELDRWRSTGRSPTLWLRDDDAVAHTPALDHLLALCAAHDIAPMIAAIPLALEASLVAALASAPRARIAMHGLTHANRARPPAKAAEIVPEHGRDLTLMALRAARVHLGELFDAQAIDCYVPPWNRISPEVAAWLPAAGFGTVSTFGAPRFAVPGLREANTHVDIIDWKGGRSGRPSAWIAAELARELAQSRTGSGHAIGILTHHLAHDAQAWRVLTELLEVTKGPAVRWVEPASLVEAGTG